MTKKKLTALGMIACGVVLVRCGDDDDEDEIRQRTEPPPDASAAALTDQNYNQPVSFNPADPHRRSLPSPRRRHA